MVTVRTEKELEDALKAKEKNIRIVGSLADKIREKAEKKAKKKKWTKIASIALIAGGAAAIPFTGGASTGAMAAGITIGTVTISTAELAIILGFTLGMTAILKGYDVKYNSDGSVVLTHK